jgi:hypothetical protein
MASFETPRPKDVGILAMEMYFPRRVCLTRHRRGTLIDRFLLVHL